MAKPTSLFVFPIMFRVILSLVEYNMGCMTVIGTCRYIPDCSSACKVRFGEKAFGYCDRDGDYGRCLCYFPCPSEKNN
ncbi:unnamed protein product [Eruca vesicaria subsp. sativa]|uniref:Defensin-like protein n=1 Tax=Eruca vesicaria subsp. sativa TaxID=29727 RepID=A0ABC8JCR6_ERUVS|nr:unnamed protein product [Eruca vesicaria subsp. sativa]